MELPEFVRTIQIWYKENQRNLPWRLENDPYKIWLSEILLQQTRVQQGLPYYYKFVNEFPNITSLAIADEVKVLRLWQGLGYYSRARNLHTTAKFVVKNLNAEFPKTYAEILTLKGVGEYTAAAIASFAFKEKVAVLDGNVFRVLSRFFGIEEDIMTGKGKKAFKTLANNLLPESDSDIYNQGIMEFGALQCTPSNPDCLNCPLSLECYARINKRQAFLPVKSKKTSKTHRKFFYIVIKKGSKYLMQERKEKDIWQGLYQFPLIEGNLPTTMEPSLEYSEIPAVKHVLSHQIIEAKFIEIDPKPSLWLTDLEKSSTYYSIEELEELPKPVVINNYLQQHIF